MKPENNLQHYATGARTAHAVMREALADVSGDVVKALAVIERVIVEAEAGRHPLLLPEQTARDRWPLHPHWDSWACALERLAETSGARVDFAQKWHRMRVNMGETRSNSLTMALVELGELVEVSSDMDSTEIREALRAQVPIHQSAGHSPYIVLADIPQAWRNVFHSALRGSAAPLVEGTGPCAWPVDWNKWLADDWREAWRRQFPDAKTMHALHLLADYPVLAVLADDRTKATKLDGRACWSIYDAALPRIDWNAVSARELAFMRSLGIEGQS